MDGILGKWNTTTVDLEVKSGSKQFNDRYHPLTMTNKETLCKEIQCLVEIGVLTPFQKLQYGTSIFIIPKKEFTMRFIMYYQNLNHKIVRKPYNFYIIVNIIQQLKGFHYATAFDLNMGYYNIDIYPKSCYLTTIVTEFGKLRYNILPMGLCTSVDIFQSKVD